MQAPFSAPAMASSAPPAASWTPLLEEHPHPVPEGYELPGADLSEFDLEPLDIPAAPEGGAQQAAALESFPALDLQAGIPGAAADASVLAPSIESFANTPGEPAGAQGNGDSAEEPFRLPALAVDTPALADEAAMEPLAPTTGRTVEAGSVSGPAAVPAAPMAVGLQAQVAADRAEPDIQPDAPLPSVEFPGVSVPPEPVGLALVEDDSPAAVLQASVSRRRPRSAEEDDDEAAAEAPAAEGVGFVQAARRRAFWRRPAVRGVLLLVFLLAGMALALQVAVQERDRIAAMDARARPWLAQLCVPLRCRIAPPRQIDDVVIDSSSFNKARGDSYQLGLTVKSRAANAVAMPAVELTLTDAQDQPVLRRVLLPADLGAPTELPPGGEWSTSVAVIVTTGGARVAGYRLLVFYP